MVSKSSTIRINGPKGRYFTSVRALANVIRRAGGTFEEASLETDHLRITWPDAGEVQYRIIRHPDGAVELDLQLGYDLQP